VSDPEELNVLVLLSGGIDSSACVEFYVSRGYNVSALFVDYGQPDAKQEQVAATAIAQHYAIGLNQLTITGCHISEGYIPARNSMLLCLALMNFGYKHGIVALGIHAGTPYADCTPEFERLMQQVFELYEQDRIRIDAPFLNWTKSEIWDYAQMEDVPLHLTHSNNLDDLRPVANHLQRNRE
jgi:7-cyano-7-deazaguanine synthase